MKTQDVLFAFLATGLIASCTAAPERELHGEFGITGFNLVDGEEGALMELLVDGEELYVEGENFRVSLAASEDAVALGRCDGREPVAAPTPSPEPAVSQSAVCDKLIDLMVNLLM